MAKNFGNIIKQQEKITEDFRESIERAVTVDQMRAKLRSHYKQLINIVQELREFEAATAGGGKHT